MLRIAASRLAIPHRAPAAAAAAVLILARARVAAAAPTSVRFYGQVPEGTSKDEKRTIHKAAAEAEKDWTAPAVSYEEVKRRAEQPSFVRFYIRSPRVGWPASV
jgi:hypothetical protein